MSNSIINILNNKLGLIVNDLVLDDNNLDIDNIYKFLKKKKYFKIDKKNFGRYGDEGMSDNKIIMEELLDHLKNDPKFLIYNNSLEDVKKVLIKIAEEKKVSNDFITIDYVNDIIIGYINSYI